MSAPDFLDFVADPSVRPLDWQSPSTAYSNKPPVPDSADLRRIVALPRRDVLDLASPTAQRLAAAQTSRYRTRQNPTCQCRAIGLADGTKRGCIDSLRPVQAQMLAELGRVGGLLGGVGVGHGKTIVGILAPLAVPGVTTAVLLLPPGLVPQLIAEYKLLAQHWRVPSLISLASDNTSFRQLGEPTLYLLPYSLLSRPSATTLLDKLRPDLVLADEADKLRNKTASGTGRVLRYLHANPSCKFACWTGSLSDKTIHDYAHLAARALGEGSPLPLHLQSVDEWAMALDPSEVPAPPGALLALCEPGEHVTDGFRRRLVETPGVIITTVSAVDCELTVRNRRLASPIPPEVRERLRDLRNTWARPDGEELLDAMAVATCAQQIACGFFYYWIYPRGERVALIEEWFARRKAWNKELREALKNPRPHLDSPHLLANAAARYHGYIENPNDLPEWPSQAYAPWAEIKDQVQPETAIERISDYLAADAADWALSNRGIVWYGTRAFGSWVAELSGLELHTGGPDAAARIDRVTGEKSIIASIKSHGRGRDKLQYKYATQLIAEPPSSGAAWEQLLGRLHRAGQRHAVSAYVYRHTQEFAQAVDTAMARGAYVESTLGTPQKLRLVVE